MVKFNKILSTAVPLPIENITTNQIIPAQFLKTSTREGLEKKLFKDWRYHNDGSVNDDFILNKDAYFGKILITGNNFGCGKNHKNAIWAIHDYGFRVVISSSFNNNFKYNALNNNILPAQISKGFLQTLLKITTSDPKSLILVDFEEQIVTLKDTNQSEKFEIN